MKRLLLLQWGRSRFNFGYLQRRLLQTLATLPSFRQRELPVFSRLGRHTYAFAHDAVTNHEAVDGATYLLFFGHR